MKENKSKIGIVILIIGVVLLLTSIFMLFVLPSIIKNEQEPPLPAEPPTTKPEEEKPVIKKLNRAETDEIIQRLLVSNDAKLDQIERYLNNKTVNSSDLGYEHAFYNVYVNYFNEARTIPFFDFLEKFNETFTNIELKRESININCSPFSFEYNDENETFKRVDTDDLCGIESKNQYVYDTYKVLDAEVKDDILTMTIGIFFGKGDRILTKSDYFLDYERTIPDTNGYVVIDDNKSINGYETKYENAAKYVMKFYSVNDSYSFISSEKLS